MTQKKYEIEIKKDASIKPLHLNVARKTPFWLQDGVKAELQRLIDKEILRWLKEN